MNRVSLTCLWTVLVTFAAAAHAKTLNGNDFALYLSEAVDAPEHAALVREARGKLHYFRYLKICVMTEGVKDGRPQVAIQAVEPSSLWRVEFKVAKAVSLRKLAESPASSIGDAIAVTGKLVSADPKKQIIVLNPVIVRHKDRLSPKMGKELMAELDPGAFYYSYTGGRRPVHVTYKDRDLLKAKGRILGSGGALAWAEYLEKKLAERRRERAAAEREAAP